MNTFGIKANKSFVGARGTLYYNVTMTQNKKMTESEWGEDEFR